MLDCHQTKGQKKFSVASQKPHTLREITAIIEQITEDKLPSQFNSTIFSPSRFFCIHCSCTPIFKYKILFFDNEMNH